MAPTKSSQSILAPGKGVTKSIVSLSRRAISTRTQQQKMLVDDSQNAVPSVVGKRKADISPVRTDKTAKRSALGNVTHAMLNVLEDSRKHTRSKADVKKTTTALTNVSNGKRTENHGIFVAPNAAVAVTAAAVAAAAAQRAHKIVTRSSVRTVDTINPTVNEIMPGLKKVNISTSNAAKVKKKTETTNANQHHHHTNNNAKANAKPKVEAPLPSSGSDDDDLKLNARRISNEFDLLDNEDSHYMSALEDL